MKHFGDITKLSGYDLPIADIITGGSPCQDLSVAAGKHAGLAGERSGLFMEQMRIVKEMRERDRATGRADWLVRPRFMVWENVPGAFSSGKPKGADFATVIEEIIKVCEPGTVVHVCVPDRGWPKSGCYYAENGSWSIAWRVHDAQFWGVPQRRKRIALVADFGGLSAPDILFERRGLSTVYEPISSQRQGLQRDTEPGEMEGQETAGGTEEGAGEAISFHITQDPIVKEGATPCLSLGSTTHGQATIGVIANTLDANYGKGQGNRNGVERTFVYENHSQDSRYNPMGEICKTVSAKYGTGGNNQPLVVFDKEMYNAGEKMTGEMQARYDNVAPTVRADNHPSGICTSVVRRLTPMECERLQGYPDGWTDIGDWTDSKGKKRKAADGPRYKALGNSIALPFWAWLARRICAQYERPMTMASLFDGIGGFPLAFSMAGCNPVWASEIEEFPIAVTKIRFGDK